jgi:hypothetical protein
MPRGALPLAEGRECRRIELARAFLYMLAEKSPITLICGSAHGNITLQLRD